jgi:hypothetical protein
VVKTHQLGLSLDLRRRLAAYKSCAHALKCILVLTGVKITYSNLTLILNLVKTKAVKIGFMHIIVFRLL